MSQPTAASNSCPRCGAALPSAATAGLCPRCLIAEAMAPTHADAEPAGTRQTFTPEELAPSFPQLEILECLGRGGMGVVYKARQKSLNRFVALKLLAPERGGDARFAARFTREAQALAALNHPNIVTVHDFGQAGGFYFLLMEFVDGVNLRQLLRTRKFTPEEALAIVPPLCDALQFAHERGIVHRDIKPENILLDKAGRVRIADFGIAKMLGPNNGDDPDETTLSGSATPSTLGTPGYSAPEQKTSPRRVDSRADIYSLGVVFYEMLTGELPGQPLEPPSHKVQIDVRLDHIVLRALEQQPELRYQQASQVKTDVATITSSTAPPANVKQPESLARPWRAISGLPAITFALCYAGFIGYLVYSAHGLPERMASHFGWNLKADGWMPRHDFLLIFGGLPLIFPLIFLGLAALLRCLRAPSPIVTYISRKGLWFACVFTGFLLGMHYLTVQANNSDPPQLPTGPYLFLIIGFLIASLIFAIQAIYDFTVLASSGPSSPSSSSNPQREVARPVSPRKPPAPSDRQSTLPFRRGEGQGEGSLCSPPLAIPACVEKNVAAMNILYRDSLIEITDQEVVFRRYYLPFGGDRHVSLSQIESIQVRPPSIWNGSWRIWGGGPQTWFPLDGARPNRDAIFVANLRGAFMRIGFTVEDSKAVTDVLKSLGLLPHHTSRS